MPKWNKNDFYRVMRETMEPPTIAKINGKVYFHWNGGGRGVKNSGNGHGPPGIGEVYVKLDDGNRVHIRRVLSHQDRVAGRGWIETEACHTLNIIRKKVNL